MLARNTLFALIPKPYYRTSVQRHIRCCSVLLVNQENKLSDRWKAKKSAIENKFRNRFPRTAEIVFRVKDGGAALLYDGNDIVKLQLSLMRKNRQPEDLSLRELELCNETVVDIRRMIPLLCIFAIPVIGNFIVAFVAYTSPLRFLSPHFWTDKQKATYTKEQHANRVSLFLPVIDCLESKSPPDTQLGSKLLNILKSVQAGVTPNLTELLACKEMFGGCEILCMKRLRIPHLQCLLALHCQRSLLFKIDKLEEWGSYIYHVDRCITRNGGVSTLSSEQLRKYCFQRGVNADAMTEKEMRNYLHQWIAFSEHITGDNLSLLLHAPAIIGLNHKSNSAYTDDYFT